MLTIIANTHLSVTRETRTYAAAQAHVEDHSRTPSQVDTQTYAQQICTQVDRHTLAGTQLHKHTSRQTHSTFPLQLQAFFYLENIRDSTPYNTT
jgi:hypothetical protein